VERHLFPQSNKGSAVEWPGYPGARLLLTSANCSAKKGTVVMSVSTFQIHEKERFLFYVLFSILLSVLYTASKGGWHRGGMH
jgi:hypothetical protein